MRLEVEGLADLQDPTPGQIADHLGRIDGERSTFAIMSADPEGNYFIQTAGNPIDGYVIEHRQGSDQEFQKTVNDALPIHVVIEVFQGYAQGDAWWNRDLEWKPMDLEGGGPADDGVTAPKREGCLAAVLVMIGAGVVLSLAALA